MDSFDWPMDDAGSAEKPFPGDDEDENEEGV